MILPILGLAYSIILSPVLIVITSGTPQVVGGMYETRHENKIFWPAVAAIAIILTLRNISRLRSLTLAPHIICLFAYLAFAGASVFWAFKPELSSIRFAQQVMVVSSVILPALLASRSSDMMLGMFLCFSLATVLNVFFVMGNSQAMVDLYKGYPGYFPGKNYLGELVAVTLLFALYRLTYPGLQRVFATVIAVIACVLLVMANSKTSFALALAVPVLAATIIFVARMVGISPAIILWLVPLGYLVFATAAGINLNRLSYMLYSDSSFSGRTVIWDFANFEIARKPLFGWGYQSFWLVGPDGPAIVDAPGWVKIMPNAHNGYLDTQLELGYIGFILLLAFITATVHGIGRVAQRDPARAWLLLSLALFIIITNGLESWWMRGFEMLWMVFLMVAAEVARHLQPVRAARSQRRYRGELRRSMVT